MARFICMGFAILLWSAILLPWWKVDFHNGENALVIAIVAVGLGISELASITSMEDLALMFTGFLYSIGVICICIYATSGLHFGLNENHLLHPQLRTVFLATGFLPAIISSGYFYYLFQTENASHVTGISLGFWLYWAGFIIGTIFEINNSRLLPRATPPRNDGRE